MRAKMLAFAIVLSMLLVTGCTQSTGHTLSVSAMNSDLNYLLKLLGDVHPATASGFTEEQTQIIAEIRESIKEPMTRPEFFFTLNRIVSTLGDSHTQLRYEQTDLRYHLPLAWLWSGLYVWTDAAELRAGDKITKFGGMEPDVLLDLLVKYIPAENQYWVKYLGEEFLTQGLYLENLGLLQQDGTLELVVERGSDEVRVVIKPEESISLRRYAPPRRWVGWELRPEENLGIFHLDMCRPDAEYDEALSSFFKAVEKEGIQNVVLDLRYNGGGSSAVANRFIQSLDTREYLSFGVHVRSSWRARLQRLTAFGAFTSRKAGSLTQNKNHSPVFKGDVYVLTAKGTFSSASMFAVYLSDNDLATVVGEPMGGAASAYGDMLRFELKQSGFGVSVSYKQFTRPNSERSPANTLHPDVFVETTIEDILNGRDAQLEKVIELIRERS